ncbi:hypothetical protein GGU11DRAFT_670027, partial [Lentinula aff. detonsa]
LPLPRLLASPIKPEMQSRFFLAWVHIRDFFIYLLSRDSFSPLSNKKWRSLLDIMSGESSGENSKTKAGKQHAEMKEMLEKFVAGAESVTFQLKPLSKDNVTGHFNGRLVIFIKAGPLLSDAREILWDLNELNFQQELLSLDRQLDRSGMLPFDRQLRLEECWVG